jgi:hypothetical protein
MLGHNGHRELSDIVEELTATKLWRGQNAAAAAGR